MTKNQENLFPGPTSVRMTVPVPHHVRESFQRLAAVQGCSVGKAMSDWMSDTVEGVNAMADLLEKAKDQPRRALFNVNSYSTSIGEVLDQVIVAMSGQVASRSPAEGVSLRGEGSAGRSEPTLTPPVSNTGGKVPRKRGQEGKGKP